MEQDNIDRLHEKLSDVGLMAFLFLNLESSESWETAVALALDTEGKIQYCQGDSAPTEITMRESFRLFAGSVVRRMDPAFDLWQKRVSSYIEAGKPQKSDGKILDTHCGRPYTERSRAKDIQYEAVTAVGLNPILEIFGAAPTGIRYLCFKPMYGLVLWKRGGPSKEVSLSESLEIHRQHECEPRAPHYDIWMGIIARKVGEKEAA